MARSASDPEIRRAFHKLAKQLHPDRLQALAEDLGCVERARKHHAGLMTIALILSALIYYMHRDNMRRLIRGEEPRIGSRSGGEAGAAQR